MGSLASIVAHAGRAGMDTGYHRWGSCVEERRRSKNPLSCLIVKSIGLQGGFIKIKAVDQPYKILTMKCDSFCLNE